MKYIRRTSKIIASNFLEELLSDRKIIEQNNDNEKFFHPTKDNEEDPMLLDHIEDGLKCLLTHLNLNHEIYLVIDPDVDGYTSSALFYNYIMGIAPNVGWQPQIHYHVPEGKEHGLSTILEWFPEDGNNKLIVCPDSSSNDYNEHKQLNEQGYDILILDHHEAEKYSENAIVINNQLSTDYPNKQLSGVGVVYKFFEFLEANIDIPTDVSISKYIDLVALGEISDMMRMNTLENRYICDYGLKFINNKFFSALVEKQSYSLGDGPLTQIGVAFYITPLINALIRVGNDIEKETLFEAFINPTKSVPSTKRGEKGKEEMIVTQAVRNCVNAKSRQTRERDKAAELLDIQISNDCLDDNKILILNADNLGISNNLTGLCAMGVAAAHKKPVMLGRIGPDGHLKGSIRGREDSELKDFKEFLMSSGYMDYVEGHANAAGFSLKASDIDKLTQYANEKLKDINFNEGFYEADFITSGNSDYLNQMIKELDKGRKFYGQGCPEPVIVVENITIDPKSISIMGTYKDTVKFSFNGIEYLKFKAKDLIEEFSQYTNKISITAAGRASVNHWGGKDTPQILLDEIEIKESSIYDF